MALPPILPRKLHIPACRLHMVSTPREVPRLMFHQLTKRSITPHPSKTTTPRMLVLLLHSHSLAVILRTCRHNSVMTLALYNGVFRLNQALLMRRLKIVMLHNRVTVIRPRRLVLPDYLVQALTTVLNLATINSYKVSPSHFECCTNMIQGPPL